MTNRQWFIIHSWAGFAFAGLLLLICVTGALAAVSYEIQYLSDDKYRAIEARPGPVAWQQLESNLSQRYPSSYWLGAKVHNQPYLAGQARLMTPDGFRFVFFDPASGQLLGEGGWGQLSRFLRNIHMYLSMGKIGKYIVTLNSLLLLLSLVSSFYVYRKWWQGFWALPKQLRWQKRVDWSSWHKWMGLWTWWFIALIALTGLWYLTERIMSDVGVQVYPSAPSLSANYPNATGTSQPVQRQSALPITTLIQAAQRARPDMDIRGFYYPTNASHAMRIVGQSDTVLVRNRANRVYVNPYTAQVLGIQDGSDLSALARMVDTADPLHFGNFGGNWSQSSWLGLGIKVIYAVFGLMMSALVITGMRMHYLRTQKRDPKVAKWLGITGSLSLGLSVAAIVYTSLVFDTYGGGSTSVAPKLGSLKLTTNVKKDTNSQLGPKV